MKHINLLAGVLALALVATPALAQSRKDKKAAQKAAWEMEQQQKQEEAALKHQMRMDSIRAAQEEQKAAKEKERRLAAEAEAEQEYQKSIQTYVLPCWEEDTDEYYTAHVQRIMKPNQVTLQATALLRLAQQQMRQKIKGRYKAVVRDYMDQLDVDDKYTVASHIESAGEMVIDQMINDTKEACREMTRPDADGNVTLYLSIRVSKKELTDGIVNQISKDKETAVRQNEETFRSKIDWNDKQAE